MLKSGAKRKDLFKKGDFVVWRHWYQAYGKVHTDADYNVLVEDRGVVLKVKKDHRSNILSDGTRIKGRQSIDVWKAEVLFASGERDELPLVCLKHFGED